MKITPLSYFECSLKVEWHTFQYVDHIVQLSMGFMGKWLKNIFRLQIFPENSILFCSRLKFHSISRWPRTKFYFISGSPTTKFLLHFGVPSNQISLHFGVPHNQFHSILRSPTTDLESSGGVRENRSLTKGFTAHTKEHWGSLHILRSYIVSNQFFHPILLQICHPTVQPIFSNNFPTHFCYPTQFSNKFILLICPNNFFNLIC